VKFGLFYELFVPPSDPGAEARILRELVDQIVHADRCGWHQVWLTEHHFLRGFSHMSAPEVIFGAAAYATQRIRFGFGLALTPPAYNHPVRIAERVATLDCISGGRVDLGSGRSTTPAELYGFGLDPDDSRAQWDEGLRAVARLLAEEQVELDGRFVRMPARTVLPRPVQKPHPPLWVGGVGPGNAERAAKLGLGMLFFALNTAPAEIASSVEAYRKHIGAARPIVRGGTNDQTAAFVNGLATGSRRERERIRRLAASSAVEHTRHGSTWMTTGWPDPRRLPESFAHVAGPQVRGLLEAIEADPGAVARGMLDSGFVIAGTADDLFPTLDTLREVGVDQVIVHMQMGGIPHADIMESIAVMGAQVIPRYA
jgi:alkanesulfonate monooxygenase SsuD/methylene tetrahydromethanopterin reductase-like flavin-dependent oxidoreductase (luciferase family)